MSGAKPSNPHNYAGTLKDMPGSLGQSAYSGLLRGQYSASGNLIPSGPLNQGLNSAPNQQLLWTTPSVTSYTLSNVPEMRSALGLPTTG